MGYRIGEVTLHEFGPFEHAEIDLNFPGLTVIEGIIEGVRGCSSNGAGKSFIFDGVSWVLYGRCIRPKYVGDKIIRLASKGGTYGTVELVGGPKSVVVERYRKHPKYQNQMRLLVGKRDVTRGTDVQTLLALETIIGMDFTSFCNSVAFGAREDVKSFFAADDTDRKKVLDKLLGLSLYGEAAKVAQQRLRALAEELNTAESECDARRVRISEKESLERGLQADADEVDVIPLMQARVHAKSLRLNAERAVEDLQSKEAELSASEATHKKAYVKFEKAYDKAKTKYDEYGDDIQISNASTVSESNVLLDNNERRVNNMNRSSGKVCSTCEQPITKKHVGRVLKELEKSSVKLRKDRDASEKKLEALAEWQNEYEWPDVPEDNKSPVLKDAVVESRHEASRLWGLQRAAETRCEGLEAVELKDWTRIKQLQAEIEDVKTALESQEKVLHKLEAEAETLQFWVDAFSNKGLKSFLIEAEIPGINRHATQYARQLLGSGATVRLSATTKLKTKDAIREKLDVEGSIPGFTNTYAGASKGQKRRMDLSLLLSFREIVDARASKSFNQLFADELFDGVDPAGAEAVSDLLREISRDCPVVLVTHDPRIKPAADRIIIVHHKDGKAVIRVDKQSTNGLKKRKVARRKSVARHA